MPRTQRGLKRAKSQHAGRLRKTKFTTVVNKQKGRCWYCSGRMGGDCTKEHLLAQTRGGTDSYPEDNLKAAHGDCNSAAGHLPVEDKLRLREIAHAEGKTEMLHVALQMRRADARIAFSEADHRRFIDKSRPKGYWKNRPYMRNE